MAEANQGAIERELSLVACMRLQELAEAGAPPTTIGVGDLSRPWLNPRVEATEDDVREAQCIVHSGAIPGVEAGSGSPDAGRRVDDGVCKRRSRTASSSTC